MEAMTMSYGYFDDGRREYVVTELTKLVFAAEMSERGKRIVKLSELNP